MTPLHLHDASLPLLGWRIDSLQFAASWDSGKGAAKVGGRWNHPDRHVVYASADAATAILEVAVHKGFELLDRAPHFMTAFEIPNIKDIHVVMPHDIPNPRWLEIGAKSKRQLDFGHELLDRHAFVAIPSAVSQSSWNIIFDPTAGHFAQGKKWNPLDQRRFGLDPRFNALPPSNNP